MVFGAESQLSAPFHSHSDEMTPDDNAAVRRFLKARDWEGLLGWAGNKRSTVRVISALLMADNPLLRWRAIEAMGKLSALKAKESKLDHVRQMIRRLFWGMNDESGSLIRHAPEAIAEILFNVPELVAEYGPMLASFVDQEPFPAGVHWALARLSAIEPELFGDRTDRLMRSTNSPDPFIRGCSIISLANLKVALPAAKINGLLADATEVEIYDIPSGQLQRTTVAQWCREHLIR